MSATEPRYDGPGPVDGTPEIRATYPLTPTQEGMLVNSLRHGGGLVEIEQIVCRLDHAVDPERMRAAWQWATDRHGALRTEFDWSGAEPQQRVLGRVRVAFDVRDLASLDEAVREAELAHYLDEDRARGFDLDRAPLSRVALFVEGPEEHTLVWTFHHVILDGRSFTKVLRETLDRYDGVPEPSDTPEPFERHCRYVRGRDTLRERAFWSDHLRGLGGSTPLPVSRPAHEHAARTRHDEVVGVIEPEAIERLEALGRSLGFTLANVVQAAWAILLARYARTEDVVFGVTRSGRHESVPGAHDMVGCLITTVPLRVHVDPDADALTLLRTLRSTSVAMRPNEQASLSEMRAWAGTSSRAPLFETLIVFERYLVDSALRGLGGPFQARGFSVLEQSDFPLVVAAYQDGAQLIVKLEHDPTRCATDDVTRLLGHFRALVEGLADRLGEGPVRVGEIGMIGASERAHLLAIAGGGAPLLPVSGNTLPEAFDATLARSPDAPAVTDAHRTHSYADLDDEARTIGARLADAGVSVGDVVAVCLPRGAPLAASLVAVLRAGAIYLPLDATLPEERMAFLLEDAGARVALVDASTAARVPSVPTVFVDDAMPPRGPAGFTIVDDAHAAYLLYTSGSTGRPKGVLVSHRALFAHARAIAPAFGLRDSDRCLQFTSPSFDVSLEEMLPTWMVGAHVVLRSDESSTSMNVFLDEIARRSITVLNLPSAFFTELALHLRDARASMPSSVRLVVVGGERPSAVAYAAFANRLPSVRVLNAYGPTEVTITSTYCDLRASGVAPDGRSELPIGHALGTCRAYVLDSCGDLAPFHVPGELCLAGPQVALGYLHDPELTASRFLRDPFVHPDAHPSDARMYRTGDLVRRRSDGQLEFLGRIDDQIKVRGYRIEPGEIENALASLPGVREAVVGLRATRGHERLVAWVRSDESLETARLRDALEKSLPSYMVPTTISVVPSFPLTPSGKVDRRALPDPDLPVGDVTRPEGELEAVVAALFGEVLGREDIGADENFFDLGGHSLLAIRLLARLNARARTPVSLGALFANPTVRDLARLLKTGGSRAQRTLVALNRADPPGVPLYCICGVDVYSRLARAMEPDRRVYGTFLPIETEALERAESGRTNVVFDVDTMAREYITLIRRHRPEGPYVLGGLSFGGIIAYEMARQLAAEGEQVPLVALFDAILPRALRPASPMRRLGHHLRSLATHPGEFGSRVRERLRRRFEKKGATELVASAVDEARDDIFRAAAEAYDPIVQPYGGRVALFRALGGLESELIEVDADNGWTGLITDGSATHTIEGTHLGLLREPGVLEVARLLRHHLRDVDERPPTSRSVRATSKRLARTSSIPPSPPRDE